MDQSEQCESKVRKLGYNYDDYDKGAQKENLPRTSRKLACTIDSWALSGASQWRPSCYCELTDSRVGSQGPKIPISTSTIAETISPVLIMAP